MEFPKLLLEITQHLLENHPDIDINNLQGDAKTEKAVLSAIGKFAQYEYDPSNKFFTTNSKGLMFATEVVELEQINTLADLYHAIKYLNQAYDKRVKSTQQTIDLPEHLYTEPKKIQVISRKNVMAFLHKTYGLHSEKEFLELKTQKQKEVISDLYRNFTGFIHHKKSPGSIFFSMPNQPELKLRYTNLPDFQHSSLFPHIRDMRSIKENTKQLIQETTKERIEQIKKITESQINQLDNKKEQDQEQEL